MTWREERLAYRLGGRRLRAILEGCGLAACALTHKGFFPPQIVNRAPGALALEHRLERLRWLWPALPFVVVRGEVP